MIERVKKKFPKLKNNYLLPFVAITVIRNHYQAKLSTQEKNELF
jgi:hypothetical protein